MGDKVFLSKTVTREKVTPQTDVELTTSKSPTGNRLHEYDLVVVGYSEFGENGSGKIEFDKQLLQAVERGTSVCFLHYDEPFPGPISSNGSTYVDTHAADRLGQIQPGFFWLTAASNHLVRR